MLLWLLSGGHEPPPSLPPQIVYFQVIWGQNGSPAKWVWGEGSEEDGRTSENQKASLGGLLEEEKEADFSHESQAVGGIKAGLSEGSEGEEEAEVGLCLDTSPWAL